ncbi:MAG TPA: hypothetical protein DEG17_19545 [Cyanobacteria bacterium UBA11149]|nr:hypothetical protein [Cyanobacteria bacterium UBA11367]HBE56246.1 hypothetical protein [Cyanobacteria bacterium UBA11366]HBK64641.1 hypothetical protein [Cyanobacteria bacterium UBA11166]HBR76205.1 hypothetical protein [Cyanobacteria bacterium UBA11159]HBS68133.1 hypothetical protein [Cyanobacteria bacterium UBA11153]HBW90995.1 hypothetical protein [Cyanobacteria bacterium UBA11149]HCA95283.1 hypothetical protein [Cyanobacteria bacterium UBA9226]
MNDQPQDGIVEIKAAIAQIQPLTERVTKLEETNQETNQQTQSDIEQLKQYLLEIIKAVNILTQRVAKLEETNQEKSQNNQTIGTVKPETPTSSASTTWQEEIEKNKQEIQERLKTAQTDIDKSKKEIEQGIKKLGESLNNLFKP